jgi:hypothetical protein
MMIKKRKGKDPDDPLEFCLGHELRLKITGLEFCLVYPIATYFLQSGNFLSSTPEAAGSSCTSSYSTGINMQEQITNV